MLSSVTLEGFVDLLISFLTVYVVFLKAHERPDLVIICAVVFVLAYWLARYYCRGLVLGKMVVLGIGLYYVVKP